MEKIKLDNVTLLALGSTKIQENINALEYSIRGIDFGAVKFISHEKPANLPSTKVPMLSLFIILILFRA